MDILYKDLQCVLGNNPLNICLNEGLLLAELLELNGTCILMASTLFLQDLRILRYNGGKYTSIITYV